MKLILVLSVVFLVSADARPRGSWLGKITRSFQGLMSAGKEMACKYQLPFSTKLLSCDSSEPRFCGDYDCPNFYEKKLNVSSKDYTLRCYPKPYKWVSTTFNGRGSEESETYMPRLLKYITAGTRRRTKQTEAFWRLFRYIQGENEKKMKINMTVPVTMRMELDDTSDSFCKENATMSFFIPFKHQIDAPAPTEENVHLEEVEPFCAYVKVYGGWSSKWKVERNYKALVAALKRDGFGDDFRTDVIYSAGYDDPMKMFNRHNEVWLVSKNQSPKGNEL